MIWIILVEIYYPIPLDIACLAKEEYLIVIKVLPVFWDIVYESIIAWNLGYSYLLSFLDVIDALDIRSDVLDFWNIHVVEPRNPNFITLYLINKLANISCGDHWFILFCSINYKKSTILFGRCSQKQGLFEFLINCNKLFFEIQMISQFYESFQAFLHIC